MQPPTTRPGVFPSPEEPLSPADPEAEPRGPRLARTVLSSRGRPASAWSGHWRLRWVSGCIWVGQNLGVAGSHGVKKIKPIRKSALPFRMQNIIQAHYRKIWKGNKKQELAKNRHWWHFSLEPLSCFLCHCVCVYLQILEVGYYTWMFYNLFSIKHCVMNTFCVYKVCDFFYFF